MAKRRVYELAKDYGMKGAEFVQVLQGLGFEKVKTHMAVLDDADQMVIEVRLQAAGYQASNVASDDSPAIRKKSPFKKKPLMKKKAKEEDASSEEEKPSGPIKKKLTPKSSSKPSPIKKKLPAAAAPKESEESKDAEPVAGETAEPIAETPAAEEAAAIPPASSGEALAPAASGESTPSAANAADSNAADSNAADSNAADSNAADSSASDSSAAPASSSAQEAESSHAPIPQPETAAAAEQRGEASATAAEAGNKGSAPEQAETPLAGALPETEAPTRIPRPLREEASDVAQETVEAAPEPERSSSAESAADETSASTETESETSAEPGSTEPSSPEELKGSPAAATPTAGEAAAGEVAAGEAAAGEAEAAAGPKAGDSSTGPKPLDSSEIRRLPQPERKARILGRIELPKETIRDATRRSAPGGGRNPGSVDSSLRARALQNYRSRGPQSGPGQRRGPSGPGGARGGFAGFGRRGGGGRKTTKARKDPLAIPPGVDPDKLVQVQSPVTVKRLSEALGHKVQDLLFVLLRLGVANANINAFLDKDQVELVALELGRNVEVVEETHAETALIDKLGEISDNISEEYEDVRPPIVTFMGHVDHGKTTLLDALRQSSVTKSEVGGITQHVGAYKISMAGTSIVILDTPGHAAFTAMRARGAQVTDIVVLIVAADDGVMPQTEEALNHAKAAEVPVIVAINKIDKDGANAMRIKQQLATLGLQPEDWGGKTQYVELSALTGQGLEDLVESVALEAEVLELQANAEKPATGRVIEAKQTPAQGNVISVIVMDGTLRQGDLVLCGSGTGRVRTMHDDHGKVIKQAGPGTPVEILGLPELPAPGDPFHVVKNQKMAREAKSVAEQRAALQRQKELARRSAEQRRDIMDQLAQQSVEEVRLIIKADVMGSLEPIKNSLEELSTDEVRVKILHSALGGITETDVSLAEASNALIVGFNSVPDENARKLADQKGVKVRFYNVIYQLIDDCRALMEGLLSPEEKEEIRGHAEIRRIFKSSKLGNIAGCYILDGKVGRNNRCRLVRDGVVVHSGKISGLRREKDDTKEVREGFECGILLENYDDIKVGDIVEAYEVIEVKRYLGDPK
ncbi:MAG: translation initiation factor IF-2 [Planctomycetota bacterium]|nr:MAG: translation initiation factor IF-2 [Planctomycetota bacterium]